MEKGRKIIDEEDEKWKANTERAELKRIAKEQIVPKKLK